MPALNAKSFEELAWLAYFTMHFDLAVKLEEYQCQTYRQRCEMAMGALTEARANYHSTAFQEIWQALVEVDNKMSAFTIGMKNPLLANLVNEDHSFLYLISHAAEQELLPYYYTKLAQNGLIADEVRWCSFANDQWGENSRFMDAVTMHYAHSHKPIFGEYVLTAEEQALLKACDLHYPGSGLDMPNMMLLQGVKEKSIEDMRSLFSITAPSVLEEKGYKADYYDNYVRFTHPTATYEIMVLKGHDANLAFRTSNLQGLLVQNGNVTVFNNQYANWELSTIADYLTHHPNPLAIRLVYLHMHGTVIDNGAEHVVAHARNSHIITSELLQLFTQPGVQINVDSCHAKGVLELAARKPHFIDQQIITVYFKADTGHNLNYMQSPTLPQSLADPLVFTLQHMTFDLQSNEKDATVFPYAIINGHIFDPQAVATSIEHKIAEGCYGDTMAVKRAFKELASTLCNEYAVYEAAKCVETAMYKMQYSPNAPLAIAIFAVFSYSGALPDLCREDRCLNQDYTLEHPMCEPLLFV
jgi:hypothetical protein